MGNASHMTELLSSVNLSLCSFFWTGDSSVDVYILHSGNSLVHIQVIVGVTKPCFRALDLIGELISPLAYSLIAD